jgi:uncharacterized protein YaeQ
MARFRATFDLHDFAVELHRCSLRHRHPDETDEQIERRLVAWLQDHELNDLPSGLMLVR